MKNTLKLAIITLPFIGLANADIYAGVGANMDFNRANNSNAWDVSVNNPLLHVDNITPNTGGGYRFFGGWRFTKFLGIEAGAGQSFSSVRPNVNGVNVNSINYNSQIYDAEFVGYIPLWLVDLYAKAGTSYMDSNMKFGSGYINPTLNSSGFSLLYGVGVQTLIIDTLMLRAEYVEYGTSKFANNNSIDHGMVNVSVGLNF